MITEGGTVGLTSESSKFIYLNLGPWWPIQVSSGLSVAYQADRYDHMLGQWPRHVQNSGHADFNNCMMSNVCHHESRKWDEMLDWIRLWPVAFPWKIISMDSALVFSIDAKFMLVVSNLKKHFDTNDNITFHSMVRYQRRKGVTNYWRFDVIFIT